MSPASKSPKNYSRRSSQSGSFASTNRSKVEQLEGSIATNTHLRLFTLFSACGWILGCILGNSLKFSPIFGEGYWTARRISYVRMPEACFRDIMRCLSLPLFISSCVAAIGSMRIQSLGSIASRVFIFIFVANLLAATLGILVAVTWKPGEPEDHPIHPICFTNQDMNTTVCTKDGHPCNKLGYSSYTLWNHPFKDASQPKGPFCGDKYIHFSCVVSIDVIMDMFRSFCIENIVWPFMRVAQTIVDLDAPDAVSEPKYEDCTAYQTALPPKNDLTEFGITFEYFYGANVRGLLMFAILLGIAAVSIGDVGQPILDIFTSFSTCTIILGTWSMWLLLVALCSQIAGTILTQPSPFGMPSTVSFYILACLFGTGLYIFVFLPAVYYAFIRKSPFSFFRKILPIIAVAFGSGSSGTEVPLTIHILEEICDLDPRVVRFMIPVASQICSGGHALTTAIATIYIARLHGFGHPWHVCVELIFMTCVSVILSPTGLFGIRSSLEFRMFYALQVFKLPEDFAAYVLPVEWIVNFGATAASAMTNCVGVAIIHHQTQHILLIDNLNPDLITDIVLDSRLKDKTEEEPTEKSKMPPTAAPPTVTELERQIAAFIAGQQSGLQTLSEREILQLEPLRAIQKWLPLAYNRKRTVSVSLPKEILDLQNKLKQKKKNKKSKLSEDKNKIVEKEKPEERRRTNSKGFKVSKPSQSSKSKSLASVNNRSISQSLSISKSKSVELKTNSKSKSSIRSGSVRGPSRSSKEKKRSSQKSEKSLLGQV